MITVKLQAATTGIRSGPHAVACTTGEPDTCSDCAARQESICASLDNIELRTLHRIGRRRRVARGETISWAGDESATCANILSGLFKLSALTTDGREQIVGLLYPYDFVGRPYATQSEFTATALSDAELCLFPRTDFEGALALHGALGRALLRRTLDTLDVARRRMLLLGRQRAEERVAGFLLEMATRSGSSRASVDGPVTFDLPLSRGATADVLGLTIETVSRQMTSLRAAGIISLPGGRSVTIINHAELERILAGA